VEPGQTCRHVGPGGKAMAREIEIARRVLRESGNPEPRQDAIEIFPVQHVELAERHAAGTHLLERRLILLAPGIGEGAPVELVSGGAENGLSLACDTGAEIDQRAEDVEEQRFDVHRHRRQEDPAGSMPFDLSTSAAAGLVKVLSKALAASLSLAWAPMPAA